MTVTVRYLDRYHISVINSPGGVFFIFKHNLLRGSFFFQCHLFIYNKMKFRPNRCKTKPFRSRNEPHSVRDELPGGGGGGVFKGGSYIISMLVPREGSYSRKYGPVAFKVCCLGFFDMFKISHESMQWWFELRSNSCWWSQRAFVSCVYIIMCIHDPIKSMSHWF